MKIKPMMGELEKIIKLLGAVTLIFVALFVQPVAAQSSEVKLDKPPGDFDFLIGEWKITSKQLKERLNNSNEWIESKAHSKCWKILNGFGNMDEFSMTTEDNKLYVGNTLRIYNPQTKEWSLYWADNFNLNLGLTYQTKGTFQDGIGVFYGEENYKGNKVKMKFTWKKIDKNTTYWDQSYFNEIRGEWEINWIMEFKRESS